MTKANPFAAAFIFSKRSDLVSLLRTAFRTAGVPDENVTAEISPENFIERLQTNPGAAAVVDWEAGPADVLKVLQSFRADHKVDIRPTLLIAKDMSNQVVALGGEFSVTCVHVGEISNTSVRVLVKELIDAHSEVNTVRDVLRQVSELRRAGNWEQSTQALERLREKEPNNGRVAAELAENYIRADAWQSAVNCLEPFAKNDPPDVRCLHLLGRAFLRLGRAGEATNLLSRAKIISPYNVERLIDLGQAMLKIDQIEEAQEVFDEALELDPSSKGANQGRGTCMLLQGELNEGLSLIRQVSDNRELASVFNTAAVLTIHRNQHSRALKLYDTAILAIGTDKKLLSRLYFNKGIGFYRWSRLQEAITCFQKSVELDAAFADAVYNLKVLQRKVSAKSSSAKTPTVVERRTGTGPTVATPGVTTPNAPPAVAGLGTAAAATYDEIDADFATNFSQGLTGEDESFF